MTDYLDRPVEILIVEDNPGDLLLMTEALKEIRLRYRLNCATDGEAAMAYLTGKNGFAGSPVPDLIVLDLNLPKKDGREVLREIKANKDLKLIPVIVLTTSSDEADIRMCYDLHANCYVSKPADLDQFFVFIKALERFWFSMVRFPTAIA